MYLNAYQASRFESFIVCNNCILIIFASLYNHWHTSGLLCVCTYTTTMGSLGVKFSINQLVLQDNQAACAVIGYQYCLGILPFSQIQLD